MRKKEHLPKFYIKIRLAAAAVLVLCSIFQFISGGKMISYNAHIPEKITSDQLTSLKADDKIEGRLQQNEIIHVYKDIVNVRTEVWYLAALTPEKKLIVMRANGDETPQQAYFMEQVTTDNYDFFEYSGYAKPFTPPMAKTAYEKIPKEKTEKYGLSENDFTAVFIDCQDMNLPYTVYSIVMTFIGGAELLVLAWFVLSWFVDKLIFEYLKRRRKINVPQGLKKEDIPDDVSRPYTGYIENADDDEYPPSGTYDDKHPPSGT